MRKLTRLELVSTSKHYCLYFSFSDRRHIRILIPKEASAEAVIAQLYSLIRAVNEEHS